MNSADVPTGWIKDDEWHGNPALGYDSYHKKFRMTIYSRWIPIHIFGKEGHWGKFCVSAGPNSDYSYSGFVPECTNFLDVMRGVERKNIEKTLIR